MKRNEEIIKDISKNVINKVSMLQRALQFIEDSGNFYRKKLYRLTDVEYENRLKGLKQEILTTQIRVLIAEYIITRKKKDVEKYQVLYDEVLEEITKGGKVKEDEKAKKNLTAQKS